MKLHLFAIAALLLLGPSKRDIWVEASYAAVSYWNTSDCSGTAAFTQAYAKDICFDYYDDQGKASSNLNTFLNSTHAVQYYYDSTDCSGVPNNKTFTCPIGLCVFGPTPYGNSMYQMSFFAESPGPYSTIPSPSWSFHNYLDCDADYVLDNQINSDAYCWSSDSSFSWREVGCDEDYFYFQMFATPDCTGPYSTNTSSNNPDSCTEDYTNLIGESSRLKCLPDITGTCKGTVNLAARSGDLSSWETNGSTFQFFDVVITNEGSCPIVNALFSYSIDGTVTQSWNLNMANEGSVVTLFSPILPEQKYNSAGMIVMDYVSHTEVPTSAPLFICSC